MTFKIFEAGRARGGTSTTITLAGHASDQDDYYNTKTISIVSGTGSGQSKTISDYVGATRVATVSTWTTIPDITSIYKLNPIDMPLDPLRMAEVNPSWRKTGNLPGVRPYVISGGLKERKVVTEGYIFVEGQTMAQHKTNYVDPLRALVHEDIYVESPDGLFTGLYTLDDFQPERAHEYPAAIRYKMLLIMGSSHEILTAV